MPKFQKNSFNDFIYKIIRYRCGISENIFDQYFDTEESWKTLQQAFIHKSCGDGNYELLEFEGDVIVNHCVVEYIRDNFPNIVSIEWNTKIKHNLISGKTLAQVAIKNGFSKHIKYSKEVKAEIEKYEDITDSREYMNMNEDTIEALCGAISRICNKISIGVGYRACYNLVCNLLDSITISTDYESVFDAKSRLKNLFDSQGWNMMKGCKIGDCLKVYNIQESESTRSYAYTAYIRALGKSKPDDKIMKVLMDSSERFFVIGYACIYGTPSRKMFLGVATGNKKVEVEKNVAQQVIDKLKGFGIWKQQSDPYKKN